jgi:hypothetical protein
MRFTALLGFVASLLVAMVSAADPEQDAIRSAQEWAFALAAAVQTQAEAGVKDQKAIRQKAIEQTQPQEKKLRAAMKAAGFSQKQIDQGIKDDRKGYLDSFLERFWRAEAPSDKKAGIYLTKKAQSLKAAISSVAPTAKISEVREKDLTVFLCQWPDVNVRITVDPHWDGQTQLAGMKGWIAKFPADEKDTAAVASLLQKMDSTADCIRCVITPGYDKAGRTASLVLGLATKLDGFIFTHQTFYDAKGTKIIGLPGDPLTLQTRR